MTPVTPSCFVGWCARTAGSFASLASGRWNYGRTSALPNSAVNGSSRWHGCGEPADSSPQGNLRTRLEIVRRSNLLGDLWRCGKFPIQCELQRASLSQLGRYLPKLHRAADESHRGTDTDSRVQAIRAAQWLVIGYCTRASWAVGGAASCNDVSAIERNDRRI